MTANADEFDDLPPSNAVAEALPVAPAVAPVTAVLDGRGARLRAAPTAHCLIIGLVLAAMFMAAINYRSNAAWMLVFLITAVAAVSSLHAVRNLRGLGALAVGEVTGFSGDPLRVSVAVRNRGALPRYALEVSAPGFAPAGAQAQAVAAGDSLSVDLAVPGLRRGIHRLTRLRVATVYPLGLVRAWLDLPAAITLVVWPKPIGRDLEQLGLIDDRSGEGGDARAAGGDDFQGHRRMQTGDSPRHIDWKAVARSRPLLVKDYAGETTGTWWLDWSATGLHDVEAALSQLARWVIDAHARDARYGLRLPGREIPADRGQRHRERCLLALAEYQGRPAVRGSGSETNR